MTEYQRKEKETDSMFEKSYRPDSTVKYKEARPCANSPAPAYLTMQHPCGWSPRR